jgi:hypothetical protein
VRSESSICPHCWGRIGSHDRTLKRVTVSRALWLLAFAIATLAYVGC